jgi:hypothetical protein
MKFIFAILSTCILMSCSERVVRGGFFTTPRIGLIDKQTVDVVFLDARADKRNTIAIEKSIVQYIQKTYPLAWVRYKMVSSFYERPDCKNITIKLKLNQMGMVQKNRNDYYNEQSSSGFNIAQNYSTDMENILVQNMDVYVSTPRFQNDFTTNIMHTAPVRSYQKQTIDNDLSDLTQYTLEDLTRFVDYALRQ